MTDLIELAERVDLDEMKRLLAAGAKGAWHVEIEAEPVEEGKPEVYVCHPGTVCSYTVVCTMGLTSSLTVEQKRDTAALVAAAVNGLPAMIEEVERQRVQLEIGERFLDACFSAWSCGEPAHRVKTMLDRADEFRASLRARAEMEKGS